MITEPLVRQLELTGYEVLVAHDGRLAWNGHKKTSQTWLSSM
jgi:hypothetical protein